MIGVFDSRYTVGISVMQKIRFEKASYFKMYPINRFSQKQQRQHAVGRLSSALMEAVDEAQYAAPAGKPFDLLACIRFLFSKAGVILLCGLVCALLTLAFYQIVPLKYEATAKLYILENDGSGVEMSALQKGSLLLSDYREVLKTWEVHEAVRSQMGLDLSYRKMQEMLTVQIPSGSRLMYITVRHQDAAFAAALANAYAQAAYTFIVDSLHGLTPEFFSSAIIPGHTAGLGLILRLIVAFVFGVAAGACWFVIFFCLDDHIRAPDDLTQMISAPVLTSLPRRKSKLMSVEEKEKSCLLASNLLARKLHCLLLNASRSGDGVSFVCSDLVQAMAALHRKALWIRIEHRPFWNHPSGKTLGDYLEGRCAWTEIIQPFEGGGFRFAPKADPRDGKLELCVMSGGSKLELIPVLLKALFRAPMESSHVHNYSCKKVHIHLDRPSSTHTDGEVHGLQTDITVCNSDQKINLIKV